MFYVVLSYDIYAFIQFIKTFQIFLLIFSPLCDAFQIIFIDIILLFELFIDEEYLV